MAVGGDQLGPPHCHGNPAHAIAAGKSGNRRNHKPIHAAARKLKPTQRGKDKPSDTGSNMQQGLAHARLEPPLARRIANPHQQHNSSSRHGFGLNVYPARIKNTCM